MGIFEQFPYTNFHDLNLDWILHAIQGMDKKLDEFVASNVLSYADPIQWDIETQYAKNTVVVDPKTGTAYMSINPVPVGQLLTNKYYWQPIFNYDEIVNTLKKQIAAVKADRHDTIPIAVNRGDLVWVVNKLYRITKSLTAGSKIIENENAVPVTVEDAIINIDTTKNITRNTDGTITDTANGDFKLNGKNIINTADNISISATEDLTENASDRSATFTNDTEKITGNKEIDVDGELYFNTKNPIKYSQPVSNLNDFFNIVPYTDNNGNTYNVLCDNGNTVNLSPLTTLVTAEENADITDALNTSLANGNAVIVGNAYKVSSPITIPSGHCLYGNGSTLTYVGSSTDEFVITVGNNENPTTDIDKINKLGIFNITIDCNYLANGIKISGVSANVLNANVYKAKSIGIKVYDGTNPSDANLVNIRVYNELDKPHILATGIELNGSDNMLRGIRTFGCLRSIVIKSGGNQLESIHTLAFPSTVDGWTDSCGIDIVSGTNIINNAYFDNSRYGVYMSSKYTLSELNNLYYYCWEMSNTATRYVTYFATLQSFAYIGDIYGQSGTGIVRVGLGENPVFQTGLIVKGNAENEPWYFKMTDHFFDGIFNKRRNYEVELQGDEKLLAIQNVINNASHKVIYNIALNSLMISGLMIDDIGGILLPGTCSTTGVTIKTKRDSSGNVYVFITSGDYGVVSFTSECNFILPRLTKNIPLPALTDAYSHTY